MSYIPYNVSVNITITECYERTSAIGKEVEAFPATFDSSIAFKSLYLITAQKFNIDSMRTDFCKILVTLNAELHL